MVESTDGPEAEALPPVVATPTSARRRRALWGALAVLAVAAGTLAVVANDDDGSSPRLPIALGAGGAETKSAAPAAADMAIYAPYHYIAGDDLPRLGGSGPAYRLSGTVHEGDVARLASALHLTGTPQHEDGFWRLSTDAGSLEVYEGGGGTWWYSNAPLIEPNGAAGSTGGGSTGSAEGCPPDAKECASVGGSTTVAVPPPDAGSTPSPILDQPVSDCAADKCIDPVEPEPFVPPADLPSKDEAKAIALDLFATIGTDLGQPTVSVDGPHDAWYVSIEPTVDGLAASGMYFNVSVGPKGEVTSAGGMLNTPERVGDYPTIDTRAAIDRLNDGIAYGGTRDTAAGTASGSAEAIAPAVGTDEAPVTTTTVVADLGGGSSGIEPAPPICAQDDVVTDAPAADGGASTTLAAQVDPAVPVPECPPYEPPEPIDVVLHQADRVLVLIAANDGSPASYLVPGYRFHGDHDTVVDVPAVDDQSLLPVQGPGDDPGATKPDAADEPPMTDLPQTTLAEG